MSPPQPVAAALRLGRLPDAAPVAPAAEVARGDVRPSLGGQVCAGSSC
ncbi:hypothetical protein [Nocardioides sp. URHA0020]|nr:hypothetical protein [Nocardioides sp. URHA0020]